MGIIETSDQASGLASRPRGGECDPRQGVEALSSMAVAASPRRPFCHGDHHEENHGRAAGFRLHAHDAGMKPSAAAEDYLADASARDLDALCVINISITVNDHGKNESAKHRASA
jgi:hypothetical protein